ncbi:hypothetical protein C7M84_021819, partial [Penaeus vannamei]
FQELSGAFPFGTGRVNSHQPPPTLNPPPTPPPTQDTPRPYLNPSSNPHQLYPHPLPFLPPSLLPPTNHPLPQPPPTPPPPTNSGHPPNPLPLSSPPSPTPTNHPQNPHPLLQPPLPTTEDTTKTPLSPQPLLTPRPRHQDSPTALPFAQPFLHPHNSGTPPPKPLNTLTTPPPNSGHPPNPLLFPPPPSSYPHQPRPYPQPLPPTHPLPSTPSSNATPPPLRNTHNITTSPPFLLPHLAKPAIKLRKPHITPPLPFLPLHPTTRHQLRTPNLTQPSLSSAPSVQPRQPTQPIPHLSYLLARTICSSPTFAPPLASATIAQPIGYNPAYHTKSCRHHATLPLTPILQTLPSPPPQTTHLSYQPGLNPEPHHHAPSTPEPRILAPSPSPPSPTRASPPPHYPSPRIHPLH